MKTSDGESCFAPFREEELMGVLYSRKDSFRSSVRQTNIDFIIGSRIRGSGAEVGPFSLDAKALFYVYIVPNAVSASLPTPPLEYERMARFVCPFLQATW